MSLDKLRGIIPPMTTPFDENGNIDLDLIKPQVDFLIEAGVNGIVAGGSGGEGHTLDRQEFADLMGVVAGAIDGRVPFVSGIIVNSTQEAVIRARMIADIGVDALQVTPVHYLFTSDDAATFRHFETIADQARLPVLIYNVIPWNYLSPDLLLKLMQDIPGVVGVKQSAGDLKQLADLVVNAGDDDLIFTAIDALLYPSYCIGARGCISALLSAAPKSNVMLWQAVQAGDHATARAIHNRQLALWNAMPHPILPACVKAAQTMQGVPGGLSRAPMAEPTTTQRKAIRDALEGLCELVDGMQLKAA